MAATLTPQPKFRAFDSNGEPLAGFKLYSFTAGTTTPLDTYTDNSGGTPNTNPVIGDANGEANVWLGSASYKLILKDSSDVQQWSVDNISAAVTGTGSRVYATSPTLVTPALGVATATSLTASGAVSASAFTSTSSTTVAMGTSPISAGACATLVTASFSGALSTDVVLWSPVGDLPTQWQKGLFIIAYATAGQVHFRVCNPTAGSLTPDALTLNVRIMH